MSAAGHTLGRNLFQKSQEEPMSTTTGHDGLTLKEQAGMVQATIDDTLRQLDSVFAELARLEDHPDEPSTVYLRDKLEAARKQLEEAERLADRVEP
jgi:hypothetical protein